MALTDRFMSLTPSAKTILEKRYLLKTDGKVVETPEMMMERVATAIFPSEEYPKDHETILERLLDLDFLPNSPTLMNAGTELAQMSACFVLPIPDSLEGIMDTAKDMALIQRTGGGTGFSFSHLRPKGDLVSRTQGESSGAVSFLEMYDAVTNEIKQGGRRRGANMATLNASHPEIVAFIQSKDRENTKITNFNISVWTPNTFFEALKTYGEDWDLINPRTNEVTGSIEARELWAIILQHAWETGDPGMLFADHIEDGNQTPWKGSFDATNPCGEQPLLPYEACVLGSINLGHYVSGGGIDWTRLETDVALYTRFLDRIVDVQHYTLPKLEAMHKNGNRKIGLGVMGWQDMLVKMGIAYDSEQAREVASAVMFFIHKKALQESERLAKEFGPFPFYDENQATYFPRRNATVTTIAPTGTISIIAGCSSGVEPYFALAIHRTNVLGGTDLYDFNPLLKEMWPDMPEEDRAYIERTGELPDCAPPNILDLFKTAHEVSPANHVRMQAAFQEFVHNGVSKTINLNEGATPEDIGEIYLLAHELKCKGITIYRNNSKVTQVQNAGASPESALPAVGDGIIKVENVKDRPSVMYGFTEKVPTPLGSMFANVGYHPETGEPWELILNIGRSGTDVGAMTEAIGRLVSLSLRNGILPSDITDQLSGIGGRTTMLGQNRTLSVPDAVGRILRHACEDDFDGGPSITEKIEEYPVEEPVLYLDEVPAGIMYDICPKCHQSTLLRAGGCADCIDLECGFSEC